MTKVKAPIPTAKELGDALLMKNPDEITLKEIVQFCLAQMQEGRTCVGGFSFAVNDEVFTLRIHHEHDEQGYGVDPRTLN